LFIGRLDDTTQTVQLNRSIGEAFTDCTLRLNELKRAFNNASLLSKLITITDVFLVAVSLHVAGAIASVK
jgi:hypothetical protein